MQYIPGYFVDASGNITYTRVYKHVPTGLFYRSESNDQPSRILITKYAEEEFRSLTQEGEESDADPSTVHP